MIDTFDLFVGILATVIAFMIAGFVQYFLFDSKNRGDNA